MPIHIWIPIKLLCPCCDALPVLHVKQKGPLSSSVFITLFSLSFIHVSICSSSSCCCGEGGSSCPRLAQNGSYSLDASAWFLLIWPKLAQKTPLTTHPLISNDRLSLNIGINYGDVKFGSHRGAVFRANKKTPTPLALNFMPMNSFKAMAHHSSWGSLMSFLLASQICRSVRCEPQRHQICLLRMCRYWMNQIWK